MDNQLDLQDKYFQSFSEKQQCVFKSCCKKHKKTKHAVKIAQRDKRIF